MVQFEQLQLVCIAGYCYILALKKNNTILKYVHYFGEEIQ